MMDGAGASRSHGLHWAWIVLAVCFVNLFINYGIRLGYGVILPEMIRTMGITRKEAGRSSTPISTPTFVSRPLWGISRTGSAPVS
jgi:hypothetical protein